MVKKATLKDVAKLAGVSINTASRALNNKPDVHRETRKRVQQAAKEINYIPNLLAKGLKGKHSRSIGVIVADIGNPFFAEVIEGIEEVVAGKGYVITVGNSSEDPKKELYLVNTLLEQQVSGLLITPMQRNADFLKLVDRESTPCVLMARRFEAVLNSCVLNDDYTGAYQAADYLIRQGHRRILFLNGPRHMWSAKQRLIGYRQALESHQLRFDEELLRFSAPTMGDACLQLDELVKNGERPDAVFAFNDFMAIGAMRALRNNRLKVPQDVAVFGYDGIDIGEMIHPSLSTVEIAKRQLGREAASMLIDLIEGKNNELDRQIILPPKLVIRGSA